MKKFYFEALIVSVFIGILIRALTLLVTGQSLFTSIESYFYSVLIAIVSCTLSFGVHVKILTNEQYSFVTKYIVSAILIFLIYVIGNLYFGGMQIVFQVEFYGYAAVVLLVSLPLIYYFNRRIMRFNEYLNLKKSQHVKE